MMHQQKTIAVIGGGISGLCAAYLLSRSANVTLYEKNPWIGGHSRTVDVKTKDGAVPVDTGFIVFNRRNYPGLCSLFETLNIPSVKSDMSFGVSANNGELEYGTPKLSALFAQKSNLLRPDFLRMLTDIPRFNAKARQYLEADPSLTLGECLERIGCGPWFRQYFLLAMGAAIWSTPQAEMLRFPARSFLRFFENHGLLTVNDQPQWYTVKGGSREYVRRMIEAMPGQVNYCGGAGKVIREGGKVHVVDLQGKHALYDEVVMACHADQALALIASPTEAERRVLGVFRYQANRAALHSDISFMPARKKAWCSWVYLSEQARDYTERVSLSYWMNRLQPLETKLPLVVTLNPQRAPDPSLLHDEHWFEHPLFDEGAVRGQEAIKDLQGKGGLWFCGAYQRYGFHEDGLQSALAMVRLMGVSDAWA